MIRIVVGEGLTTVEAEFQEKVNGKMHDMTRGEGRMLSFMSHNMTSIKQLCNSGILLENGSVAFRGTAEAAIYKYLALNFDEINKPLLEREDRSGNGRIRFSNIVFRNQNGDAVDSAFVGTYLRIEVSFQINDPIIDFSRAIIACSFSDSYGTNITTWVSDELEHGFSRLKEGNFALEIPALNLRPQTYNVSLQFSVGTTAPKDFCDALAPASQLVIINDALFTPGVNLKEYRSHQALVPARFV